MDRAVEEVTFLSGRFLRDQSGSTTQPYSPKASEWLVIFFTLGKKDCEM